ncbi:MAG: ATP-binding protein [Candidatus Solibacter usitatus]|nr:ATP-binding protein [Candidatus Solibacter usitatus]
MAEAVCKLCGGVGWRIINRDELSAAERCQCAVENRADALTRRARIPVNYATDSFDNFSNRGSKDLAQIQILLAGYCKEYPAVNPPGLLFIGEPGTGKTHLAVAVIRRLIENGFEAVFFGYQQLLDRIRAGYDPLSGESPREAYQEALEADILLLDDLGAHRVTDWVEDTVTSIITYRCNERKPIIATTNCPDPDMGVSNIERSADVGGPAHLLHKTLAEKIGMRARSRLFEMCQIIRMPKVGDFRQERQR